MKLVQKLNTTKITLEPNVLRFEHMLQLQWRNINKNHVDIVEELRDWLNSDTINVYIGTDAQKSGPKNSCNFVTCVIVHDPEARGGSRVFYIKFKNIQIFDLWQKLSSETLLSCSIASELSEALPSIRDKIEVHVDANPNTRYASSDHVKSLAGMVTDSEELLSHMLGQHLTQLMLLLKTKTNKIECF